METKPQFQKAERKQAKIKLAITGPSGSGKTFSALMLAAGIGKKIAFIDTENKSASLYADTPGMPVFDVLEIEPPYTTEKYTAAMDAAVEAGYDVLIIDSLTHAWAGEGGLLDQKETIDRTDAKGSSYTHWATITKKQEKLKAKLLQSNVHLIATMRSKQDYLITAGDQGGKGGVKKIGLAPIQREGMEYEFFVVFDMVMSHEATVSKDRTGLFDGQVFQPSKKTGVTILEWLTSGKEATPAPQQAATPASAPISKTEPAPAVTASKDDTPMTGAPESPAEVTRAWSAKGDTRPHAVTFKKHGWKWDAKSTTWTHFDSSPEIDKTQPWLLAIGKLTGITVMVHQPAAKAHSQEYIDELQKKEGGY